MGLAIRPLTASTILQTFELEPESELPPVFKGWVEIYTALTKQPDHLPISHLGTSHLGRSFVVLNCFEANDTHPPT